MSIRIVCFADDDEDIERLTFAFKTYDVKFLFLSNPQTDWNLEEKTVKRIADFEPNFAVVDLKDQRGNLKEAGFRVIRKLNELLERPIPVIAWSVLLKSETSSGEMYIRRARGYGAIPLFKSKNRRPVASRFLSAAKLSLSSSGSD